MDCMSSAMSGCPFEVKAVAASFRALQFPVQIVIFFCLFCVALWWHRRRAACQVKTADKAQQLREVDGSMLEGGGQILRMACAYSAIFGFPVTVKNVRAGRSKPGLAIQHVESLRLVREIAQGTLQGDEVRSSQVTFMPNCLAPGDHFADPGTAGSISLMVQASLFPLLFAGGDCTLECHGGTDTSMSPSVDFMTHALMPTLRRMGALVDVKCLRRGFFPCGGGHLNLILQCPEKSLVAVDLSCQGALRTVSIRCHTTHACSASPEYLDELRRLVAACMHVDAIVEWSIEQACDGLPRCWVDIIGETSTGAYFHAGSRPQVLCQDGSEHHQALGVCSSAVRQAVDELQRELATGAAVGEYLLDQLILPASLADGTSRFLASVVSMHTRTAIEITKLLVPGVQITLCKQDGLTLVEIVGIGLAPVRKQGVLVGAEHPGSEKRTPEIYRRDLRKLRALSDDHKGAAELLRLKISDLAKTDVELLLWHFAGAGQPSLVAAISESGAVDINAQRDTDGCTALHLASAKRHQAVVSVLLAHGADQETLNNRNESAAQYASRQGRPKHLMMLKDTDDGAVEKLEQSVDSLPLESVEALLFAYAATGQRRLLEVLLKFNIVGIDTTRAKDGCSALHVAAFKHQQETVEMLLTMGADPSICNKWGETYNQAAHACSSGQLPCT